MLVQAQVVPWWGTGRPAEFSPSGFHPSRASPTGRRIGGYDYKTESFQRPRVEQHAHSREMKNSNFFGAPSPGGRSVREITSREETERPPEESTRQIPEAPPVPGTESPLEIWSADGTAPEPRRHLDYESFRLAESEQILPPAGNRKPASDRTQDPTCAMLVQAQVVPWWGTGRPAEVQSQQIQPVTGIAHRQEDRRVRLQNRVVSTTARRATRTLSGNEIFCGPRPVRSPGSRR